MRYFLKVTLLTVLGLGSATLGRGQIFDNPCPAGTSPIIPTRTQVLATGHLNDTMCSDVNGNLIFQALGASLVASDTFTRANGAIGAQWKNINGSFNISSNAAKGNSAGWNDAIWADPSFVSTAQFSQITTTVMNGVSDLMGAGVFLATTGNVGYTCSEKTTDIYIYKLLSGGSQTQLVTSATTGAVGDVLRLEVNAAGNLTCYKNGVSILTTTDTSYKNGSPGISHFGTVGSLSNWSGGNLPVSAGTGPNLVASSCKNFEQLRCVDSANSAGWAGATADLWITAAINDLGINGGTILMPCGSYTLASAIQTIFTSIIIQGQGWCTQLNYTPNTGTAFTFNVTNVPNDFRLSWGLRDLRLIGPGAAQAAVGLSLGGSSAAGGAFPLIDNTSVQLFGTGLTFGNNAFLILLRKSAFHHNGININYPTGLTNSGENIEVENCVISNATTIGLQRLGSAFFLIKGTSFDYNGTMSISDTAAVNSISLQGNYFENNNHADFISTNSSLLLQSDAFVDTAASGTTTEAITISGAGSAVISGTSANASNGSTITQVLNFNSSGTLDFSGLTTGGLVTNGVTFGASARKGLTHDVKANAIFLDSTVTYGDGLTMQQIILPNSTGGAFNWEIRHQAGNRLDFTNGGTGRMSMFQTSFAPITSGAIDLGTTALAFGKAFFSAATVGSGSMGSLGYASNRLSMNNNNTGAVNIGTTPVYSSSGTEQLGAVHIVQDTATLAAGTVTITFTGSAVFTNATSYTCVADDDTAIGATRILQNSGSSITITGTGTDVIRFICVGN